jgi:hypothetical protein
MIIVLACLAVAVLLLTTWTVCRAAWRDPYDLEAIIRRALLDDLHQRETELLIDGTWTDVTKYREDRP